MKNAIARSRSRKPLKRSPLGLVVGVVLGDGGHGVTEDHVGVVERLLHLHGAVRAAAHVVACADGKTGVRAGRLL